MRNDSYFSLSARRPPHLLLCWFLEAREVNERRQTHQTLPTSDPDAEAQAVGEEGAVGVAPLWEVDDAEQLGEQDHVDQVGAERPAGETLSVRPS